MLTICEETGPRVKNHLKTNDGSHVTHEQQQALFTTITTHISIFILNNSF